MRLGKRFEFAIAFSVFALLALIVFYPIFFGKVNLNSHLLVSFYPIFGENLPYKNIVGLDQIRLYFPNYSLVLSQIKDFQLPLWNPYIFSGNLNIASLQSAVFYPLNIFGLVLSQFEFWHVLRISPSILGAIFTYIYLRNLQISKLASFFGAISFGFGPFITTWGEEQVNTPHTIIWLPLILFCIDKISNLKGKITISAKGYFSFISLSVVFSIFAGFIQTTIYLIAFAVAYAIFRCGFRRSNTNKYIIIFGAIAIGIVISAIQLLPTAELYFNSARSTIAVDEVIFSFLLPPESLIGYLAPDFFGNPTTWNFFRRGVATYYEGVMFVGVGVLIFAIYAVSESFGDKLTKFLAFSGVIALILTLNSPISKFFVSLPVPFLSTSIANRLLFIPAFCLVILATKGVDMWIKSENKKISKYILILGTAYLFLIAYLLDVKFHDFPYFNWGTLTGEDTFKISLRNLVLPIGIFVSLSTLIIATTWKFKDCRKYVVVVAILISFAHLFLFAQKYMSFSDKNLIFPTTGSLDFIQKNQGYYRSWGLGEAYLENNFATQYKIFWPEGYNSLNILSYAEFTQAMQGGDLESFVFRADAGLGRGDSQELLAKNSRRKLLDIVGVKYVVVERADWKLAEENGFKKVFEEPVNSEGKQFGVFENLSVIPRVFLASNYEGPPQVDSTNRTEDQIKKLRRELIPQKMLSGDFDSKNVIVLEDPASVSPQFGDGSAEILSYEPNEVVIRTSSIQPKLLYLSDNFYPGWKAKVDGNEVKVLRANYTFRAVPVFQGDHTVTFYFESFWQRLGTFVSIFGLVTLCVLNLVRFKNAR